MLPSLSTSTIALPSSAAALIWVPACGSSASMNMALSGYGDRPWIGEFDCLVSHARRPRAGGKISQVLCHDLIVVSWPSSICPIAARIPSPSVPW